MIDSNVPTTTNIHQIFVVVDRNLPNFFNKQLAMNNNRQRQGRLANYKC